MPTDRRRAAARRRAWGRGPIILRFEPLEGRELLSATPLPDLAATAFDTVHNLDWGDSFHARGVISNQGNAAVTTPFHVNIYASPTPALGTGSVLLGQVTIPAGLPAGGQVPFDQTVSLPSTALDGVDSSGSIYIGTLVDPESAVGESNKLNNAGTGQGYDTSLVTITPHKPAALIGAGLGVTPDQTAWGQTVQVTAQVYNSADGDAPATRARVVLTPAGLTPGGDADITVGSLNVPAVAAWQTATVTGNITLPLAPPASLVGSTQFTLSIVQDADFVTNAMSPHGPFRGAGYDMTAIAVQAPTNLNALINVARPELSVTHVTAPTLPLTIGQPFQVTATVKNSGHLDSSAYRVRFLLVGTNSDMSNALFLADATVDPLTAGTTHDVVQTLTIPTKLPSGVSLNGTQARIAVIVDPEHVLDDANPTNNTNVSDPVSLRVVGSTDTTVTTSPTTTTTSPSTTAATTPRPAKAPTAVRKAAAASLAAAKAAAAAAAAKARASKFGPSAPKAKTTAKLRVYPAQTAQTTHVIVKTTAANKKASS